MLDYKKILIDSYVLHMDGRGIAEDVGASKSGVNDFLNAFRRCDKLTFPLPEGITNYGIAELVYGCVPGDGKRNQSYELPDFEKVAFQMESRKNMTLSYLWNRYVRRCRDEDKKYYQYRQFCFLYRKWCDENNTSTHIEATPGQSMEVDFAGKTLSLTDRVTGSKVEVVVFVAVLAYSQYIYAEGMTSTKTPQWIEVNNRALQQFGGVPALVVCDNCKQGVITNKDWIDPELNKDYNEWAEHNHTVIIPAKVKKPRYKSSVERAVGILESGILLTLEERQYFDINQFNDDLWTLLKELNASPLKNREHSRIYYWGEEREELLPLPEEPYHYMQRAVAKVSNDFHIRFDNAYYSVDKAYLHKTVTIRATETRVKIYSQAGEFICEWPRATSKGQWQTNPDHLPENYKDISAWNGPYFIQRAMTIGPNTVEVISHVLKSRWLEVQTYRQCVGILGFTKKYSRRVLEECCREAVEAGKPTYTYVKTTIDAVAEEMGRDAYNTKVNEERNRGAYVMGQGHMDVEALLSRSQDLLNHGESGDKSKCTETKK
ncbi:MAG: IS21 family transposase [Clostridia bacterium]|nr:IS21 family transposase [Clostridia bacterium]